MHDKPKPAETREPDVPIDWPHGHVAVTRSGRDSVSAELRISDISVKLTDASESECIAVDLGATRHFLHSTTARELSNMLLALRGQPVSITIHGVQHSAGGATARTLSGELVKSINEWNEMARAMGLNGV